MASLDNFEYSQIKEKLHYIQRNETIEKEIKQYIEQLIEETLLNKDKYTFNQLIQLLHMIGE